MSKSSLKQFIFKHAILLGRYKPFTEPESKFIQERVVPFVGDLPKGAGNEYNQGHLVYEIPRPLKEHITDLLYTPRGMGWLEGSLHERYSLQKPTIKDLFLQPSSKKAMILPQGTVVQVETPYTYGDWVQEHLRYLAQALPICMPLLMPRHLMEKSYVRRDLARLGVETLTVERPVLIRKAVVLHKQRRSWIPSDVAAYRQAFRIQPVNPRPGSILYLSRSGEYSAAVNRIYPSELIAEILSELGAKIVLARETTYQDYCALAEQAETVVADHGSAMYNLLLWNSKSVIEVFSDTWWNGDFLRFADAMGISNYALVRGNDTNRSELRDKLVHHLKVFGAIS